MSDREFEDKTKTSENMLWHFTSCEALPKILLGEDGLLAGSTLFMDDVDDCSLSRRLLQATIPLRQAMATASGKEGVPPTREQLYFSSGMALPTFAVSFTVEVDNPIMWQVHTKTGGVAIGFNRPKLEKALKSMEDNCFYIEARECDYKRFERLKREIDSFKQGVKKDLGMDTLPMNDAERIEFQAMRDRCDELASKLVFTKKRDFWWEKEFRIAYLCRHKDKLSGRLRFYNGKPFVTMKLPKGKKIRNFVERIYISPFGDVAKTRTIAFMVGEAIGLPSEMIIDWELR